MWLSLVEYLNGVQVVVGSNPAITTISKSRSFARGAGIFSLYPSKISKINGLAWVLILVDRCRWM